MFSTLLRHRGHGSDPGQRTGAVSDAGQGAPTRRRWIVHPFLIGLFPILSLYAHNVYETRARSLVLPIGLTLTLTLVTWLSLWCLTRDRHRAALATSLLVVLFFAFNQCRLALNALLVELSAFWVRTEFDVPPWM